MRARKWEGILILSLGGEPSSNNMRKEIGDGTIAAHSQYIGGGMGCLSTNADPPTPHPSARPACVLDITIPSPSKRIVA